MSDNTRISKLEKSHEDMSGKLDDIQDDTRTMRRQLDALKIEVREIPRAIIETLRESMRESERRIVESINVSTSGAIASSEARILAALKDLKKA